ncbi:12182_t:CDS:2 [Funneliformis mosseae]|uniref:12182_t:CDS:1 n=1 Tax=Funneliformis mosseae TaxID=27381 RepID=A0A9N8ZU95_FUNMO|nr:12182_t:CDS:2 [Funneliformis mosseae]
MATVTETNHVNSSIKLSAGSESNLQIIPSHPINQSREDNRHVCRCSDQLQVQESTLKVNDFSDNKDISETIARNILFSGEEKFQSELDELFSNDKMPFEEYHIKIETKNIIKRSKRDFCKHLSKAKYPVKIADDIIKTFSDKIHSYADDLICTNELSLNNAKENYKQTCEQLMAEYVVRCNDSLHGEPEPFDIITSKCRDDIMREYDQNIVRFPKFIIRDNRYIFRVTLISRDKEFRNQYDAYLKSYMDDFKKNVDEIYDNVFHEYKLKVNVKLPNIPMSEVELDSLLYDNKVKCHSKFDSKTADLSGKRRASEAYVQQRKNVLVNSINAEQEYMISYNKESSNECCNKLWDEKVEFIREKVKKGDYDALEKFQKDLNTFNNSYRLAASGPAIDIVWNKRLKEIESWEANVRRSIKSLLHNGKDIEIICHEIMKSTLTLVDQLAEYLGLAWAGTGQYRRTANGYMWVSTRKDVKRKDYLPSYELYDIKTNFKNLITSDPIIEYVSPRQVNTTIYGPYPTEQTITRKVDYAVTEQLIWESSKKFTFNQEALASYKQGVKDIWEALISLKFGFSQELFKKDGGTKTLTRTESSTNQINIPAGKRVEVTSIIHDQSVTINYIATFVVSTSLRMRGILLWGSDSPEKNYHKDFQERGSGSHWRHDFGDITEIYNQMMQTREPWLWDECKRDHPQLTSVLEQLKDPQKYEFIVSGKFNGVNGVRVEDKIKILS